MTIAKLEATRQRLENELEDIDSEVASLNEQLVSQAGDMRNDPKAGDRLAARVVALQARRVSVEAKQRRNDAEAARLEAVLKGKEYKQGQKQLAELEKFFQVEADEVHSEFVLLRERLQKAVDKRAEYLNLLSRYGLELTEAEMMTRRSNKDIAYLVELLQPLQRQAWIEERRASTARIVAEITDPKRAAEMDKRRTDDAKRAAEYAKKHPLIMPENKPVPVEYVQPHWEKDYGQSARFPND